MRGGITRRRPPTRKLPDCMIPHLGPSDVGLSRLGLISCAAVLTGAVTAAAPASAQTIPATGYPPPESASEQQTIEQQARQAWFNQHRQELWTEAQNQVDQERRNAWLERGRRLVPPAVTTTVPEPQVALVGTLGVSSPSFKSKKGQLGPGVGAELELRADRWWGLQADGGIQGLGDNLTHASSSAIWSDAAFLLVAGSADSNYLDATHAYLGLGLQTLFPLGGADVPGAFLGPYLSVGTVNVFGPLQNGYGYAGILVEARFGYRFALESARTDPFKGITFGFVVGPVLGF